MKIFEREALVLAYLTGCLYIIGYTYYEAFAKGFGVGMNMVEVSYLKLLTMSITGMPSLLIAIFVLLVLWGIRGFLNKCLEKIVWFFLWIFRILWLTKWVKRKFFPNFLEEYDENEEVPLFVKYSLLISLAFYIPCLGASSSIALGKEHAKLILGQPIEKRVVVMMKDPKDLGTLYYLTTIGNKTICTDSKKNRLVISNDEVLVIKAKGK